MTQPVAKISVAVAAADLLARYRAVLSAAWAARDQLAGPRRLADERAFLPAALSLQETPVHPAPRRAMWIIMALFATALAWSILSRVDVVAVASGRIVVSDRTKVVQPLESAVVSTIRVKDGDRVSAGQVLVELDATSQRADLAGLQEQQHAARREASRAEMLLRALASGRLSAIPGAAKDGVLDGLAAAEWADVQTRLAQMDSDLAMRRAQWATARELVSKAEATLPLARQREADLKALSEQGFVAGHTGQDRTRDRIEQESDLATHRARVKEAEAAIAEGGSARAAYVAETRRALADRLAAAQLKLAQLDQESAKVTRREGLTRLVAPVSGVVQQLAIHSPGGVVTEAQPLMVIVPEGAPVTAEVMIENKDIGFVREGQAAAVKLETFNFTRYGTLPATVTRLSADAVQDEKRGALFTATVALATDRIEIDGRSIRLTPGMNVTVEMQTGSRRVIEYLLSPIRKSLDESLKER
jgi:hemolysin D